MGDVKKSKHVDKEILKAAAGLQKADGKNTKDAKERRADVYYDAKTKHAKKEESEKAPEKDTPLVHEDVKKSKHVDKEILKAAAGLQKADDKNTKDAKERRADVYYDA